MICWFGAQIILLSLQMLFGSHLCFKSHSSRMRDSTEQYQKRALPVNMIRSILETPETVVKSAGD